MDFLTFSTAPGGMRPEDYRSMNPDNLEEESMVYNF